jgi:hypothetical protein
MSMNFAGGLFIATSVEGIYTSTDGNNWHLADEPNGYKSCYFGAVFGNGLFVSVGNGIATRSNYIDQINWSTIATSKDATSWNVGSAQTPPSRLLMGSLLNEHRLIVHGPLHLVLVSADGENWTTEDKIEIPGTVYGNKMGYYSGKAPVVLSSKDGVVWRRMKPTKIDDPVLLTTNQSAQASEKMENGVGITLNGLPYKLNITAEIGQHMEIQASTNLIDWNTISTITNAIAPLDFTDPDATNFPVRFYRLKIP